MSPAVQKKYEQCINDFRNTLVEQRTKTANLVNYGDVGNFWSAVQTKEQLVNDVTGPNGFHATLNQYIQFLDQFLYLLNDATNKQIQLDAQA